MKLNQRKTGVVLSYVQMAAGSIIMLAYTPIMLRLLGKSEYGIYNLAASVVSYLGLFNFGFGSAYVRYYMKYKTLGDESGVKRVNGMFLIVFLCISTLALIAGLILAANTHIIFSAKLSPEEIEKTRTVLIIMVINLATALPSNIFSSYVTANEKYIYHRSVQLIKTIASPFVMIPILLLGYKSIGMVIVTTVLSTIGDCAFVLYAILKLKMRFSFKNLDFKTFIDMWRFSFFIFLNMIIDQLNSNLDKVLLGMFRGTAEVAVYGLAANLRLYFQSFSSTIYTVFIPRIHKLVNEGNNDTALTNLFTKVGRLQFLVLALLLTGFAFFGREFILLWGGVEYKEAYPITLILFFAAIIPLVQNMGEEIQRAKNKHHYRSFLYGGTVIINVLMSIPLIRIYGAIGATVGTVFASVFGSGLAMNIIYYKVIGINVFYYWKNIAGMLPGMILPIAFGILAMKSLPLSNFYVYILSAVVFVIIYCVSIWLFTLNSYEKTLIKTFVVKFKRMLPGVPKLK